MNNILEAVVTIATAIVGLAIVSVLVSRKAQTPEVIQAAASGFNNALAVANSPVTGAATAPVLSYPNQGFGFFAPPTLSPFG